VGEIPQLAIALTKDQSFGRCHCKAVMRTTGREKPVASTREPHAPVAAPSAARFRFADVEFDEAENQLRVGGHAVVVEPRPLQLLLVLLRRIDEVVTKEELLDKVWEGRPTVDHVLANAVSKLRVALGEDGAARLVTVPRMGYKLLGPALRLPAETPELVLQVGCVVPGREAYVLDQPYGKASADIWLARHAKLGQIHAFRFAADSTRLPALQREYTAYQVLLQKLGPRDDILRMLDAHLHGEPQYLEFEFPGETLSDWALNGDRLASLSQAARLDVFVQIARAVAAAHSVGVLHEHLGPERISLVKAPAVLEPAEQKRWLARLNGFGGATDARGRSNRLPQPSGVTDVPDVPPVPPGSNAAPLGPANRYLAPELLAGQVATMQSDVYALGLLLWQLVVGDFERPLTAGWQAEVTDDLLRQDILAATEVQPVKRLQSVAELVSRVANLEARRLQHQSRLTEMDLAEKTQARMQRRNATLLWLLGATGALAAGLVAPRVRILVASIEPGCS
jgi:DNA-binding winged helix-turn-helix (wHTH) protein